MHYPPNNIVVFFLHSHRLLIHLPSLFQLTFGVKEAHDYNLYLEHTHTFHISHDKCPPTIVVILHPSDSDASHSHLNPFRPIFSQSSAHVAEAPEPLHHAPIEGVSALPDALPPLPSCVLDAY